MKRVLLAAIATLSLHAAVAQTEIEAVADPQKEAIIEFLKVEGYVPGIDENDGDIIVKVAGTTHYVRLYDTTDSGFHYIELYCIYNAENTSLEEVAAAANDSNRSFKQVRVSYRADDEIEGRFNILFETPCFVSGPEEFNRLFSEYVDCIDESSDYFFAELSSSEQEEE